MSLFSSILSELTKSIQGGQLYKEDIAKCISNSIGISITPDQIQIKEKNIFLKVSPTIKTIVRLKQKSLIEALKSFDIKSIG
jgi:hypothetical protein